MITTTKELQALMERAHKTDAIGLDTEFVWERTFYPQLGLIQLALSNEECFLIDPCDSIDLAPLGKLLADKNVVKIFHDAPQDLAILRNATGYDPVNIFDTRLAAGFAGLSSTLSLAVLIECLLDIKLSKSETRTNWLRRPLNPEQMDYALDDVRYLRALRVILQTRILPESAKWLNEELKLLNQPDNYGGVDDNMRYTKVKGAGKLSGASLSVLQDLSEWRENEAKKRNRPRGHIIRDNVLLAMARVLPDNREKITECGEISKKTIDRYGDALIGLIKDSRNRKAENYPQLPEPIRLSRLEKEELSSLQNYITLKCDVNGIDPALIGNMSELREFIRNAPSSLRLKKGWRKTFLADS